MQLPELPEGNHPLVQPLLQKGDQELLSLFQRYPTAGRYFAAMFCRYGQVVYTLTSRTTRSLVQGDYLFIKVWEYIFNELRLLAPLQEDSRISLQSWIVDATAVVINQLRIPPVEEIHYSLETTPPVFWCYLQQSLNQLSGELRLVLLLSETFRWSAIRIAAYLQAEGETVTAEDIPTLLQDAYHSLIAGMPEDIQNMYINDNLMAA